MSSLILPDELLLERDGPVAVLTMNRPEQLNASNAALHRALVTVWLDLAVDPDVAVVVLTGAGRAFSSGGDLNQSLRTQADKPLLNLLLAEAQRIGTEMASFPKPLIAAVNGPAVGLGFSLALLCDFVLIEEDAFLSDPHLTVGLVAGDGAAMLLPHYTSLMRAKELIWTGAKVSAAEAVEFGFATRVTPAGESVAQSVELAKRLAQVPSQALQDTKRAMNLPLRQSLVSTLELGLATERASVWSDQHRDILQGMLDNSSK